MHHYLKDDFVARSMPLISSRLNCSFWKGCRERSEHRVWSPPQALPSIWANLRIQSYPSIRQLPQKRDGGNRSTRGGGDTNSSEERQHWYSLELCRSQGKALPEWVKRQTAHTGVRKGTSTNGYTVLQRGTTSSRRRSTSIQLQCQPFIATWRAKLIIMEKLSRSVP